MDNVNRAFSRDVNRRGFKDLVQVDGGEIGRYIPTGWPLVVS